MFARWKKNIFLHFALSYVLILLVLLLAMLGVLHISPECPHSHAKR